MLRTLQISTKAKNAFLSEETFGHFRCLEYIDNDAQTKYACYSSYKRSCGVGLCICNDCHSLVVLLNFDKRVGKK